MKVYIKRVGVDRKGNDIISFVYYGKLYMGMCVGDDIKNGGVRNGKKDR